MRKAFINTVGFGAVMWTAGLVAGIGVGIMIENKKGVN